MSKKEGSGRAVKLFHAAVRAGLRGTVPAMILAGTIVAMAEEACICDKKCGAYERNEDCEVCSVDFTKCGYKMPNVVVSIYQPSGWYSDRATVTFSAIDAAGTGNFEIVTMLAKIGQNGGWMDVTEEKALEISENCTVYVQVIDQNGKTYERSKPIKCFDTVKPTLNAAVSDGVLTVHVSDTESGPQVVYVNGYKFTDLANGVLTVRLQKFDAGYEYFTIYAMDRAGNTSEVYKIKNPYYKDPSDDNEKDPAAQLPSSALASLPGSATAEVTDHTTTDSNGNTLTAEEQKKAAMAQADAAAPRGSSPQGKDYYTVKTATGKVFYLIVDRDGDEEQVYFLTEITENDLLNVTSDNSETLPKNSAALESQIPVEEAALPNNNDGGSVVDASSGYDQQGIFASLLAPGGGDETVEPGAAEGADDGEEEPDDPHAEDDDSDGKKRNAALPYIVIGVAALLFIGGAYYFKVVRKRKDGGFAEDEDEDEEEEDHVVIEEDDDFMDEEEEY